MQLSSEQLQKISDISADLGVVSVASIVLPALFDQLKPIWMLVGLLDASLCFACSLVLIKAK